MAAIDFPNSPSVNDEFTVGDVKYVWTGTVWRGFTVTPVGPTGPTGPIGPSTSINATNDTSTTTLYPVMVGAAGSNQTPKVRTTATALAYNASTGTLTASTFSGALSGNASTVTNGVYTTGDQTVGGVKTFSGRTVLQGQVETTPGTNLGTTGTLTIDFSSAGLLSTGTLDGNITFASSNLAAGRSVTVRVVNGTTLRTVGFPTDWVFVGSKPADIAASKTGILTATSFGTANTAVVAAWAVQE